MSRNQGSETSRADRFKAFRDGSTAYRTGKGLGSSPYLGEGPKLEVLRKAWVTGYSYARRERAAANARV